MTIEQDVSQTWHDAIIELFELNLEPITGLATDKYYFTANLMPDNTKISWKGIVYEPFPIEAAGFERTTKGQIPTPELTVANVLGTLASVVNALDDLVGAKVTRRRTLLKYLDGGSSPDPAQEFPDDIFYIERKVAENSITITWQLASKIDLEGLQLPRRIITQNYCLWKYRGNECGYAGPAVANEYDQPITTSGATSAQGQAYLAAYSAFRAAKSNLANAEAQKNNLLGQKQSACDPASAQADETLFFFGQRYFNLNNANDYSFVIQDGDGNNLVALWNGSTVDVGGSQPLYRPGLKQYTGRKPGNGRNGTGSAYSVVQYIPASGGTFTQVNLGFGNGTFGIKDQQDDDILFVNGSRVQPRPNGSSPGYEIGGYASEGFAPIRSISNLVYNNPQCAAITNAYNSAVGVYNNALAQYNAAVSALNAAYAALPADNEIKKRDKCGKRLQSCRLRFGTRGALPFGGFPGANLTK